MKHTMIGASLLALASSGALAGGLDRSGQSILPVFADHNTASLSFGVIKPSVKGKDALGNSYDVGEQYTQTTLSYTGKVDQFSFSVIMDEPFGADISYNNNPATSTLGGTGANLNSQALSLVGRYNITDRFSVFGGLRLQRLDAEVMLNGTAYGAAFAPEFAARAADVAAPLVAQGVADAYNGATGALPDISAADVQNAIDGDASALSAVVDPFSGLTGQTSAGIAAAAQAALDAAIATGTDMTVSQFLTKDGGYLFEMDRTQSTGYLVGAAYEIPDIALRVVGTYHFETEHTADTTETVLGISTPGTVDFVTPQSFNLEAQTGIAPGTLLTLGYRWTETSAVDIIPDVLGSDLVTLDDSHRYSLGIGRQFSDTFAGSVTLIYEPAGDGSPVSPLGPTDGMYGISLGGRYKQDNFTLSGGVNYSWLGDADTGVGGVGVASFEDSSAIGVGFKAEMKF